MVIRFFLTCSPSVSVLVCLSPVHRTSTSTSTKLCSASLARRRTALDSWPGTLTGLPRCPCPTSVPRQRAWSRWCERGPTSGPDRGPDLPWGPKKKKKPLRGPWTHKTREGAGRLCKTWWNYCGTRLFEAFFARLLVKMNNLITFLHW